MAHHAVVVEVVLDDLRGPGKQRIGSRTVAVLVIPIEVAGHIIVQLRGAGLQRIQRIDNGLKLVVFHDDQFARVHGDALRFGDDAGHRFAGQAHLAGGEAGTEGHERLHGIRLERHRDHGQRLETGGLQISAGQHGDYTRMGQRGTRVDGHDLGVGAVGAHEPGMRRVGEVPVQRVGSAAGDHAVILEASMKSVVAHRSLVLVESLSIESIERRGTAAGQRMLFEWVLQNRD